jgi:hypothetical protein
MSSASDAALINALAIQRVLNLPKLYGPNGFENRSSGGAGGPPADLVAVLQQLETATVDPALLTGGQTVASVTAQTIADLNSLADINQSELLAASTPLSSIGRENVFLNEVRYPGVAASLNADAKSFTPGAAKPPFTVVDPPPPPAGGVEQYLVTNMTTGVSDWQNGQAYSGPVAGLRNEFVDITTDNVNVTATKPNNFIHTGSGDDAIDVSLLQGIGGGTNVLDGGGGSNFLVGGTSNSSIDNFFVDHRNPTATTWSTVSNFHTGDAVTIYGVKSNFFRDWQNNWGAEGYKGFTFHEFEFGFNKPSGPGVAVTLVGYTRDDLTNGRLSVSFGNDPASGSDYMFIKGT